MFPFLLIHLSALLPTIPRILKGTFTVQSQHSSVQPYDISQFSVTQISSNPVRLSSSTGPHIITATFLQDGRSGIVECFGSNTTFAFNVSPPFFSTSLSLPQNATASLSILSHHSSPKLHGLHFHFCDNIGFSLPRFRDSQAEASIQIQNRMIYPFNSAEKLTAS
jgi:hypothetical protein